MIPQEARIALQSVVTVVLIFRCQSIIIQVVQTYNEATIE